MLYYNYPNVIGLTLSNHFTYMIYVTYNGTPSKCVYS